MALNLGVIRSTLKLDIDNFKDNLKKAQMAFANAFGAPAQANVGKTQKKVKDLSTHLKEVERIVSGILISQAFYGMSNDIQRATGALLEFMGNMQKAQIAMSYFLGNNDEAEKFLLNMKDFAAQTAFSTEQALVLARRLMGAQIRPESIRPVMEILNDAASATGGTAEQMDRLVLALTQIKTYGKLAGQEVRQVAEAGVPVYQILNEELGISKEKLMEIGELKIDGDTAVAAILNGLSKRYSGAAKKLAETVPGMMETIQDDLKIVGESMFETPYNAFAGFIRKIRDGMEYARATVYKNGFGGLFEKIFDKGTQTDIRQIGAAVMSLGKAFQNLGASLRPAIETLGSNLTHSLKVLIVPIASLASYVVNLTSAVIRAVPPLNYLLGSIAALYTARLAAGALYFLWRITGMGMIASSVAAAVTKLTKAIGALMMVIYRNPLLAALSLLAAGALYFAYSLKPVQDMLNKVYNSMTKLAGVSATSIFKPKDNPNSDISKYNEQLESMKGNLKEVGAAAGKAGKKVKDSFTAGFDEVYQVPEALGDVADGLSGIEADAEKGLDPNAFVPPILDASVPDIGMPGIPAIEPGKMFDNIKEAMKNFFTSYMPKALGEFFTDTLPTAIKNGFKTAASWITANGPGIWQAVKDVTVQAASAVWDFTVEASKAFGSWLMSFDIVKSTVNSFKDFWKTWGDDIVGFAKTTWDLVSFIAVQSWQQTVDNAKVTWSMLSGILKFSWDAIVWLVKGAVQTIKDIVTVVFEGLKLFWETWGDDIVAFFHVTMELVRVVVTTAFDAIAWVVTTYLQQLKAFWEAWGPIFVAVISGIWEAIKAVFKAALDIILTVVGWVFATLKNIMEVTLGIMQGDWERVWTAIKDFFSDTWTAIVDIGKAIFTVIADLFRVTFTTIRDVLKAIWTNIKDDVTNTWNGIKEFISGVITWFGNAFTAFGTGFVSLVSGIWNGVKTVTSTIWDGIAGVFTTFKTNVVYTFTTLKDVAVGIFKGMWDGISGFISSIIGGINGMIDKINSIEIKLPEVEIPEIKLPGGGSIGGGKIGGQTLAKPSIPKLKIPGYAKGGLIDEHMLIQAGEGGRREAIIPLDNKGYMKPFSAAVAGDIISMIGPAIMNKSTRTDDLPPIYVGTLIADDRSLKELERRMRIVRLSETSRGSSR